MAPLTTNERLLLTRQLAQLHELRKKPTMQKGKVDWHIDNVRKKLEEGRTTTIGLLESVQTETDELSESIAKEHQSK